MLKLCPICAEEFIIAEMLCPDCGCNLVPERLSDGISAVMVEKQEKQDLEFVELCRPRLYPLAMLVKQMLEQNGVQVIVQGANAISVLPHLAIGGELRVLVDRKKLDYARALYQSYFEGDEDTDYIMEN